MANKCVRIIHYIGSLETGGSQSMIMSIYRNIDRTRMQFDFVVHSDIKSFYWDEINQMGGNIYVIKPYKIFNHFSYIKSWKKLFANHLEYRIIHCHVRSTAGIVMKIAKKRGLKTISHSHSTSNGNGIKSIVKYILQLSLRKYGDYFIGCSQFATKWLFGEKICESDRCFVLQNSINTSMYVYDEKLALEKRKQLGISSKNVIIQIGRFVSLKNHMFSIDIFECVLKKNPNSIMIFVGDGPLKNSIINKINEKGLSDKIMILSNRNDTNELLMASDKYIMPSLYEGLPMALIEAQACSLPCIISNSISAGFVCNDLIKKISLNESAETWANVLLSLKTPRTNRSKQILDAGFDASKNAQWLFNFYLRVLDGGE